jgi:hypothetical protein
MARTQRAKQATAWRSRHGGSKASLKHLQIQAAVWRPDPHAIGVRTAYEAQACVRSGARAWKSCGYGYSNYLKLALAKALKDLARSVARRTRR